MGKIIKNNIALISSISFLLLLTGCASQNLELTSVTNAQSNSLIKYSPEVEQSCTQPAFNTKGKNIYVVFDASPSTSDRISKDLANKNIMMADNQSAANQVYIIKSKFAAVRPFNSRYASFDQIGTYIEDPNKTIPTERLVKEAGIGVDFTFLNPITFIADNVVRQISFKRSDKWIQGKGRDPDGKCLKSFLNSCEHWEYIHELDTTITEEKSGKSCTIKSQAKNMLVKPEILVDQHIELIENNFM